MLGCDGSDVIFLSLLYLKRDRIDGFCCLGFQIHHASLHLSPGFFIVRLFDMACMVSDNRNCGSGLCDT
jgi:hypothetical protein